MERMETVLIVCAVAMLALTIGRNSVPQCDNRCYNVLGNCTPNLSVVWSDWLPRPGTEGSWGGLAWPNDTVEIKTNMSHNETLRICNHEVLHVMIKSAPEETDEEERIVEWLDDRLRMPLCDDLVKE